jgi:ABC-2 type transport system ATP-binding protein
MDPSNSNTVISLTQVSKTFDTSPVLQNITLNLQPGKFYALLGKNGSGKSTLMRILMGYEHPDAGSCSVLGRDLGRDSSARNFDVGYVSENLDYQVQLNVRALFKHLSGLYPKWDQKIFESILQTLGLDQSKYFRQLSRGQKMQVAFAGILASKPRLICLDEITAVLDANARSYFMSYLGQFVKEGGTVLMATNIVSEVQHFADHIILLEANQIRLDIPLTEIPKMFCKVRKKFGEKQAIFDDPSCIEVSLNSDNSTSHLLLREAAAKYTLEEGLLDKRGVTAEELFIYYTKKSGTTPEDKR